MAKKNEFKPDKPRAGLLSRLYLTPVQRKNLLKWTLYALVLLALSVLQDVIFSRASFYGATSNLLPCGIFLICISEGLERSSVFALVTSLLCLFSDSAPGPYCIVLITFLATLVTYFRQSYLQKGFPAVMLCCSVAMLVYELVLFIIGAFLDAVTWNKLHTFLLTGLLSLIAAPILYPILNAIRTLGGNEWNE